MFEGFATQLVDKYIAPYADVDPEQLRVGIRNGKVVLRDVRLKTKAFDALALPLTVQEGVIGELEVEVAWSNLRATPMHFNIRDVSVIVGLTSGEQMPQRKAEQLLKDKLEQLLEDEVVRKMRLFGEDASSLPEQSFAIRLFSGLVGPLHVSIRNVHLRYEDTTSSEDGPFAVGVRFTDLILETTDESWQVLPPRAGADAPSNKKLSVEGFALYWQTGCDRWAGFQTDADAMYRHGAYFVLPPAGAEARLLLHGDGVATGSKESLATQAARCHGSARDPCRARRQTDTPFVWCRREFRQTCGRAMTSWFAWTVQRCGT
jgi:hypothetical protein